MKKYSDIELKPEDYLILYCSQVTVNSELKDKISALCNSDLNWNYIINFTTQNRLRPLLYHNLNSICPEKVPEDVLNELKIFYHENVRKNLLLTGEMVKIINLLNKNGINSSTYKGPILAQTTYKNIGLREFSDIDILIDKADVLLSKKLMIDQGYILYPELDIDDSFYMKLDSEFRFINQNNGSRIELNWDFKGNFFSLSSSPNFLFYNMKKRNISNFEVYSPSTINELLMLCIHSAKHNWSRLAWICDISEFIKTRNIDWNILIKSAEKLGIKRILFINLMLTYDLYNIKLPNEILKYINTDANVIKIKNIVEKRFFVDKKLNIYQKFKLDLIKRENRVNGIMDCFNGLTRATYTDFNEFPVPKRLLPIYPIIRPFLLLKRYGKSSI